MKELIYEVESELTSEVNISCVCGKSYSLTQISDSNYWRNNITVLGSTLEEAKRRLGDNTITLDLIYNSILGIASFDNGDIHVWVIIRDIKCYFDCIRKNKIITATSFWRLN